MNSKYLTQKKKYEWYKNNVPRGDYFKENNVSKCPVPGCLRAMTFKTPEGNECF